MTNDKLVADLRKRLRAHRPAGQQGWGEISTLVTILWPIVDRHELVARFRPLEIPRQAGFTHYELGDGQ